VRPDASVARPVHALSRKALEEIPLSTRPPSSAPSTVSRTLPLRLALLALALRFLSIESPATPPVVINEIHFHPAEKRTTEFIEIHNPGTDPVDLSRWTLEKYHFPKGTALAAGGFAVVATDPAAFRKEFGFEPLGPLRGKLKHRGETLRLRDAKGEPVDTVSYQNTFPWPVATSGEGPSLERIHPSLPSASPGSWRSAGFPVHSHISKPLVPLSDSGWRWRPGRDEASTPIRAWRMPGFTEDASWQPAHLCIGYGDEDDQTVLDDMRGNYTSLFLRRTFHLERPLPAGDLVARIRVDDGCIIWLNGVEILRLNLPAGDLPHTATASDHEAPAEPETHPLPTAPPLLREGANLLAVQVFNTSKDSSDLSFDMELRPQAGAPLAKSPTPGRPNSVLAPRSAPALLEVRHTPQAPRSNQPVTLTVLAEPGLSHVALEYQTVEPGAYIRRSDPLFEQGWNTLPMNDEGRDGDQSAHDGTFTATVPATVQSHRRLVRYRIRAHTADGLPCTFPREDDSCPNRAWFVYDGPPPSRGSIHPGKTPPLTFPPDFLATLPAYHLLAQSEDVAKSQWDTAFHRKRFQGTLVVNGVVHDHILFHNRGQGSAHISGKNKWGLKLNRHQPLAAKRNDGSPYREPWESLNLNPGLSTPYIPILCGIGGLDEALSFRAYQLAGTPAANTHWIQWRVVSEPSDSDPNNPYAGDLRGLYLAVQDMDGDWIKEQGLPDGNVYSIQSGRKHLARGGPADPSDWNAFLEGIRQDHPEEWWREHLNLPAYFGFHAMNRLLANVDVRPDGNHGYYRHPEGRWSPIPWDLDMMFVPRHHQPGFIDAHRCLNVPAIRREYTNRAREILDLFCSDPSPEGGQIGQLLHELSGRLQPRGFPRNWTELDAVHWNFNPRKNGHGLFFRQNATAEHFGGRWERRIASADFAGFCRYLLEFTTDSRPEKNYQPNDGNPLGYGFGYLAHEAHDPEIPDRPTLSPSGGRNVTASPFKSPSGTGFRAIEWRAAEIGFFTDPSDGIRRARYELEPGWSFRETSPKRLRLEVPSTPFQPGRTYRLRARFEDDAGRTSQWSKPVLIR
jgi:hypothetical protein